MTNNDILRQLRYSLNYSDAEMIKVFKEADFEVSQSELLDWLQTDEETQVQLKNSELNFFLDGLINQKRGRKPDYQKTIQPNLTNNIILRKLKIAFNYKDFELIELFKIVDVSIGKHELSAFFRNPKQSQYRDMGNQYLRNFLHGLQKKLRPTPPKSS